MSVPESAPAPCPRVWRALHAEAPLNSSPCAPHLPTLALEQPATSIELAVAETLASEFAELVTPVHRLSTIVSIGPSFVTSPRSRHTVPFLFFSLEPPDNRCLSAIGLAVCLVQPYNASELTLPARTL